MLNEIDENVYETEQKEFKITKEQDEKLEIEDLLITKNQLIILKVKI